MAKRHSNEHISFDPAANLGGCWINIPDGPSSELQAIELARMVAAKTGRTITIRDKNLQVVVTIPSGNKGH
jgi:hypothetical protein